jgi:hypothetical protein
MKTWQQAPAASVAAKSRLSGVPMTLLIVAGLLLAGTAAAYAQLPEPRDAGAGRVLCGMENQKQDTTCPKLSGAVQIDQDTGVALGH